MLPPSVLYRIGVCVKSILAVSTRSSVAELLIFRAVDRIRGKGYRPSSADGERGGNERSAARYAIISLCWPDEAHASSSKRLHWTLRPHRAFRLGPIDTTAAPDAASPLT